MNPLKLTKQNPCMQAQTHPKSLQSSLGALDFDREEQGSCGSERSDLDWEALAEERNLEYGVALQEAEGIARHEKALEVKE